MADQARTLTLERVTFQFLVETPDNPPTVRVKVGDIIRYVLTATSSTPAAKITIQDAVPEGTTLVSGSITGGGRAKGPKSAPQIEWIKTGITEMQGEYRVKVAAPKAKERTLLRVRNEAKAIAELEGGAQDTVVARSLLKRMGPFTIEVNSTGDAAAKDVEEGPETAKEGEVTLRSALEFCNAQGGEKETVVFNIATGNGNVFDQGYPSIAPRTPLPEVTAPVEIDGTTQKKGRVALDGTDATGEIVDGLVLKGEQSVVRGLAIHSFPYAGLALQGAGSVAEGCIIGTDVSGKIGSWLTPSGRYSTQPGYTKVLANQYGVITLGPRIRIGGPKPDQRNVISGNARAGLRVQGAENLVQGNYIGTDITGNYAIPNDREVADATEMPSDRGGMLVTSSSNQIGGPKAGEGNLISGQTTTGLYLSQTGNRVVGNRIGTNAAGRAALPATLYKEGTAQPIRYTGNRFGVRLLRATSNQIGGSLDGEGNLISGNFSIGLLLESQGTEEARDNVIQGNGIGCDAAGRAAVPNYIAVELRIASHNTIGGQQPGSGNLIGGNYLGIMIEHEDKDIEETAAAGNVIQGNYIGVTPQGRALPNETVGIQIRGKVPDTTIGGAFAGAENYIAYNGEGGIFLFSTTESLGYPFWQEQIPTGTVISHNRIFNNRGHGIHAFAVPFEGHQPPGPWGARVQGNILTGNFGAGVCVENDSHLWIESNAISDNHALGIDLGNDGPTVNDSAGHAGPNNYQEYPVLTRAYVENGQTVIEGKLTVNRLTASWFRVQLFNSLKADRTGYGQGTVYLDETRVGLLGGPIWGSEKTFSLRLNKALKPGTVISATATDETDNSTSEFSRCVVVAPRP